MILKELLGVVKLSDNLFKKVDSNTKIESPGMKYRHYAPNTKCVLVVDNEIEKIKIDSYNCDYAVIEGLEKVNLGLSIMNRLIRACENNVI